MDLISYVVPRWLKLSLAENNGNNEEQGCVDYSISLHSTFNVLHLGASLNLIYLQDIITSVGAVRSYIK
jgi:hypothetical protein